MRQPKILKVGEQKPGDLIGHLVGEAPGAYPTGTKVKKVLREKGDHYKCGVVGVVLGSALLPSEVPDMMVEVVDPPMGKVKICPKYLYAVKFEGTEVPIHIGSHKIKEVQDA